MAIIHYIDIKIYDLCDGSKLPFGLKSVLPAVVAILSRLKICLSITWGSVG